MKKILYIIILLTTLISCGEENVSSGHMKGRVISFKEEPGGLFSAFLSWNGVLESERGKRLYFSFDTNKGNKDSLLILKVKEADSLNKEIDVYYTYTLGNNYLRDRGKYKRFVTDIK